MAVVKACISFIFIFIDQMQQKAKLKNSQQ